MLDFEQLLSQLATVISWIACIREWVGGKRWGGVGGGGRLQLPTGLLGGSMSTRSVDHRPRQA